MLRARPGRQIGPTFPNQLEREVWPETVDLGANDPEGRGERAAWVKRAHIGPAGPVPGAGWLALGWDAQSGRRIRALIALGCDAVYSDHADRLAKALRSGG